MSENREQRTPNLQKITDTSDPPDREQSIRPDRVLSAVANEHRRAILNSLNDASEKTLDDETLIDRVEGEVRDEDTERVSDEHRQRVRIALHHTHLPKLQEARMIDYEDETGHVQFVGDELVEDLLTLLEPYDTDE